MNAPNSTVGHSLWWPELRYRYKPKKNLTLEEVNELLNVYFQNRAFDQSFYDKLPEHLQEHFEEREIEDEN